MGRFIKGPACRQAGQVLVELLVAFGLTTVIIPIVFVGLISSKEGKSQSMERVKALAYLKESEEAIRVYREADWTTFAVNGTFYPQKNGNSWILSSGNQNIDGFERTIEIEDAIRDGNSILVESGGIVDPSTKKVTLTVSWGVLPKDSVTKTYYLTRYLDNLAWLQTTQVEFDLGTKVGTATTNTSGGEVQLGAGGYGDWCSPNLSIQALDLPKSGVANAVTAIEGRAFAGTGNNSSGESFVNVNITNTNPPVATVLETFDGYKTNDVFGEADYGYIATDTNSKEIIIVDLRTVPYTEIGYFNASGNTDADSVFVSGNIGYMTQGGRLRNFDLSSKSGSRSALDSDGAAISATGTSVVVSGNYAFVSIAGHSRELEIFDVSNPTNIIRVGWADVNGEAANDVFVNSIATRAYIVTNASATLSEFFIIDITNKNCSDCPETGVYNAGNNVSLNAVEVVSGNRAILIGSGGDEEYQVLNISNESTPTRCGGIHINSGIFDSASVIEADGDAYSYIVTGDTGSEFKIIEGGPGGQFATSGTFESSIFSLGTETAFNRFLVNFTESTGTDIKFQVAVADQVSGSCSGANYSFVGPNGSGSAYFEDDGPISFDNDGTSYENPGKCFKYKAFFTTTDLNATPVLYDFTVNYSP